MNSNKVAMYMRFSTFEKYLGGKSIIYVYAKDKELADNQLNIIKIFCKSNNLDISKVYMAIGGSIF